MIDSYREDDRPSFQFYPDDYMREPALRLCSLGARGLWMEMQCLMWFGQPRGTLTANKIPLDSKDLAKILGFSVKEISRFLKELEEKRVFSRLENGTIYCRRMYRESLKKDHIRQVRAQAGRKGAEKRWQKDGKKMAKIATSTSSSTSNSLNNDFAFSKKNKGKPRHISKITLDAIEKAYKKAKNMDSKSQAILNRKLNDIKKEHVRKTRGN